MNSQTLHPHQDVLNQYLANTTLLIESEVPHPFAPDLVVFVPVTPEDVIGDLGGTLTLRLTQIDTASLEVDADLLEEARALISNWPDNSYQGVSVVQRKLCVSYMEAANIIQSLAREGFIFKKVKLNGCRKA